MIEALKTMALGLLKSKKAAMTVAGILLTVLTFPLVRWAGLDEEQAKSVAGPIVTGVMALVATYVASQGAVDIAKAAKAAKAAPEK